jgi:hypothetical protein
MLFRDYSAEMQADAGSRLMNEAKNLIALADDYEKMGKAMIKREITPMHIEGLMVLKDATDHTVELITNHVSDYATALNYGEDEEGK